MGFARKSDAFRWSVLPFGKIILIQSEWPVKRFVCSTFSIRSISPKKPLNTCFY